MHNDQPPIHVSAHYYVDGRPHVAAVATMGQGRSFVAQGYPDPDLGAIDLNIRLTAAELGGLPWGAALDQAFGDRRDSFSWRVERKDNLPKCVTAGYRTREQRPVRAFITVAEALEFLPINGEQEHLLEIATLRIHLTAADAFTIASERRPASRMWESALDHALYGRLPENEGCFPPPSKPRELGRLVMASLELAAA